MKLVEKSGLFLCIATIIVVLFLIVFAKHGILDYNVLAVKEERISAQVNTVEKKNSHLEDEIKRLNTDINYIKHVAKHEYEMAEEDEIIFKDELEDKGKTP